MSKIQDELIKATGVKVKVSDARQDALAALMAGVQELPDAGWEALSQDAKDWFNDGADAVNVEKDIPEFADFKAPEAATRATTARRGAKETEAKDEGIRLGDEVTVLTKRGKSVTGKMVERDDEVIVLDVDGKDEEFSLDRVESITKHHGAVPEDEPETPEIKVGVVVTLVTKRGKSATGKVVELDEGTIVLDVDGKDEEFSRDRVESVTVKGGDKTEAKTSSRRGATATPAEAPAADTKPKRVNNGEVSIGQRIKELIADDLDAKEGDIAKALRKEGLEFKDNTLKLQYVEVHKFIKILRAKKLLK